jgi:hypothetical protein
MEMPSWKYASAQQMLNYFSYKIEEEGAQILVVGDTVASVFIRKFYSMDGMDFEQEFDDETMIIKKVLKEMNFEQDEFGFISNKKFFRLKFRLHIPPAQVREVHKKKKGEEEDPCQVIHLMNPTDSVMERLNCANIFNAFEYVTHAAKVADAHEVDLEKVKKFCLQHKAEDMFNFFNKKLAKLKATKKD